MGNRMLFVGSVDRLVLSTTTSTDTMYLGVIKMRKMMMTLRTMGGSCCMAMCSAFLRTSLCSVQCLVRSVLLVLVTQVGVTQRQSHHCSGIATLPSVGAIP